MNNFFLISVLLFYCVTSKNPTKHLFADNPQKPILPVALSFSKSVPDSIRDFVRVYLQTKAIRVLTFEESIELIFDQKKSIFLNNQPIRNESEEDYVVRLEKIQKPVYSLLRAEMFSKMTNDDLFIDSVRWYVIQKISPDTTKVYHSFYPMIEKRNSPYLAWKDFTDTVLVSGLLK